MFSRVARTDQSSNLFIATQFQVLIILIFYLPTHA